MTEPPGTPVVPRRSASLLVVRDQPLEVLMLQRHAYAAVPSLQVFPGGVVETHDSDGAWDEWAVTCTGLDPAERELRIAGIRETWEEAGIVVASAAPPPTADRSAPFLDVVRAGGHPLDLDALHYFAHWITPEARPRRFDTRFYLVRAPVGQVASPDGSEMVASEWIGPAEALEKHLTLMPPTRANLVHLAESVTYDDAVAAAQRRPRVTVRP